LKEEGRRKKEEGRRRKEEEGRIKGYFPIFNFNRSLNFLESAQADFVFVAAISIARISIAGI